MIDTTRSLVSYLEEMRQAQLGLAEAASMNSFVSNQEQVRKNLITAGTIKQIIEEITKNHNIVTGTYQNK